ncbi:uncharacterized protein LOC121398348 isoform X2 [Xenopus laevis]|uniref:Uncharacterized protein LOC121398348 isoform X2 n=1 Tax=Xenopus laevis TaxID=8355 RepID=A0A8J1LWN4_XENLA|nr:uncharacterized protein LOC121398348 isoform X2 [Xenopus laevis]
MVAKKHVVGIFSREAQDAFGWLINFLLTIPGVKDVRTVHISNTNYIDVMDEAYKCTFAILYHSKNRGRINVTDVTDALYDRELADLSRCLGRDGIIVVIDDLENTSLEAKNNILLKQPSIERLAIDLFLFSEQDKSYQGEASDNFTGNKWFQMTNLISGKINRRSETSVALPSGRIMVAKKHVVGIFSREAQDAFGWLINFLLTIPGVKDVRTVHISNTNYIDVMDEAYKCTFAILHHSKNRGRINVTNVTDALYYRELADLSRCLGRDRIIVVIDDLKNTSLEAKNNILLKQPSIERLAIDLFLFSQQDKSYQGDASDNFTGNKWFQMTNLISGKINRRSETSVALPSGRIMVAKKHVVGIFSREAQDAFGWLVNFLLTIPGVKDVRTVHISNTNYIDVMDEAYKCTFAILYHSKNRGRINVTDVTDALYDRELADLSRCLGRDGIIVVIDDLENTSLEAKNNILLKQPSIERLAIDLFLFSEQDKSYQGEASDNLTGNKWFQMTSLISGKINRRSETSVALPSGRIMVAKKHVVGIFSREAQDAFGWLINFLLTIPGVKDVRTVHISNTNYIDVMDEAYKCTFAILHHSKNRGRINVTNVTDALYYRELADLSRCLGRDRIIVVIDDLENTSLEAKNNILLKQPSIERLAIDLFLFSEQDKSYQGDASDNFTGNKWFQMTSLISGKINRRSEISVPIGNPMLERSSRSITGFLKNHRILILGLMVILVIVVIVTSCNRYTEHQMTTAGYPTTSNMSPTWHPPTISSSPPNNTLHPTTLSSVDTTSKLGNGTQQSPTSTFHTRNISLSP